MSTNKIYRISGDVSAVFCHLKRQWSRLFAGPRWWFDRVAGINVSCRPRPWGPQPVNTEPDLRAPGERGEMRWRDGLKDSRDARVTDGGLGPVFGRGRAGRAQSRAGTINVMLFHNNHIQLKVVMLKRLMTCCTDNTHCAVFTRYFLVVVVVVVCWHPVYVVQLKSCNITELMYESESITVL